MTHSSFSTRPTLRIDLAQLKANYEALKTKSGRAKVAAAAKADAYGLGLEQVGRALYGAGCRIYFVATAGEGKILRDAVGPNSAIYVLNGPAPRDQGVLLGAKLKPVINSMKQAKFWGEIARSVNEPPYTAIHIDTGMNRLGLTADEVAELGRDKALWSALNPEYVMSHLACAPQADHPMNGQQLQRFKALSAQLPPTPLSIANSAGIYLGRDYHFQLVRPGIALYGGNATTNPAQEVTKPVISLLAPILQVKEVAAGETIGYNGTFTAKRDMKIAVLGAGYADGIPVALSNRGTAIIHDQAVPIVGRISMDLTVIDVTDVHLPVSVGGVVVFLGDQLEDQAKVAGTINYELLIRMGQRLRRDYQRGERESDVEGGRPTPDRHARKSSRPPNKPRSGGGAGRPDRSNRPRNSGGPKYSGRAQGSRPQRPGGGPRKPGR